MKLEFIQGDSLKGFDDTPMYNPQGVPLSLYLDENLELVNK